MSQRFFAVLISAALGLVVFGARAQTPPPQPPRTATSADPYANNPAAGTTAFPLAAPAGKDSNARSVAPAGATNRGVFDPATWKYGPAFNPPPAAKIWNPVKLKMQQGAKLTGGTLLSATDPSTYCAMANAGYDFIWTEMQHDARDWQEVARMWRTCPNARAVPGVRVAYTDEREIQHALDAGALVVVVPTIDTVAEAIEARDWTYFPPLGRRSKGGGQAFDANMWGSVPGGYRETINDNIVLILMIETLEGLKNADEIAKVPASPRCLRPAATSATSRVTPRARRTTSARSTSSTTPRSRRACACAARSRGAIARISPASRRAAKPPPSPVAWPPSSARWRIRRPSPR